MRRTVGPVTTASSVGASAGLVLVWTASQFGVDVPVPVAGAFVVLLTTLGGFLVPSRTGAHSGD